MIQQSTWNLIDQACAATVAADGWDAKLVADQKVLVDAQQALADLNASQPVDQSAIVIANNLIQQIGLDITNDLDQQATARATAQTLANQAVPALQADFSAVWSSTPAGTPLSTTPTVVVAAINAAIDQMAIVGTAITTLQQVLGS